MPIGAKQRMCNIGRPLSPRTCFGLRIRRVKMEAKNTCVLESQTFGCMSPFSSISVRLDDGCSSLDLDTFPPRLCQKVSAIIRKRKLGLTHKRHDDATDHRRNQDGFSLT